MRTGNFPVGFRRGWSDWQKRDLKSLAAWAAQSGFEALDLGRVGSEEMSVLKSAGLRLGSADLLDFGGIMATDTGKRKEAVARNSQYVKDAAAAGVKVFFTVLIPGDPSAKRRDNYRQAIDRVTDLRGGCQRQGVRRHRRMAGRRSVVCQPLLFAGDDASVFQGYPQRLGVELRSVPFDPYRHRPRSLSEGVYSARQTRPRQGHGAVTRNAV